jgi:hypothetical protein
MLGRPDPTFVIEPQLETLSEIRRAGSTPIDRPLARIDFVEPASILRTPG